ncbi:MAG: MGH1-like glycoside hydrolase domain-containing protein, partial [Myxococcales bacterium]
EKVPEFKRRLEWFLAYRPDLASLVSHWTEPGRGQRRLLSLLRGHRMKKVLRRLLDETEFLSPYGVRALSKAHESQPYVYHLHGVDLKVDYQPGESNTYAFGGNSNWRGPIWMPVNMLIVRALLQYFTYYGNDFKVECPTGSGRQLNLYQVAEELSRRLSSIFLRDENGRRPVYGGTGKFQDDPHFKDLLLFYEYFHGDNGAGLGASHQTGWTGGVARLMQLFATVTAQQFLDFGKTGSPVPEVPAPPVPPTEAEARGH